MRRDERRLNDILACAKELAAHLKGTTAAGFEDDLLRQRAVERLLMIIGEAAKTLSEETRKAIPQPWREIIRLRDKGVHHYDSLTPSTLFAIATESVPALAEAVKAHLEAK